MWKESLRTMGAPLRSQLRLGFRARHPNQSRRFVNNAPPRSSSFGRSSSLIAVAGLGALLALPLALETIRSRDTRELESRPATHNSSGSEGLIDFKEVQKHNTRDSCWVIIRGVVYDITDFIPAHPGGAKPIIGNAGKDVTSLFDLIHPKGVLDSLLTPEQRIGTVDPATIPKDFKAGGPSEDEKRVSLERSKLPPLGSIINLHDFERIANKVLTTQAWSYYRSDAEDGFSYWNNLHAFKHYIFRPRILRNVENVDLSTTILGIPTPLPIFVSPAAMAGLGHPLGEINITRGAGKTGIIQGISSNASCSIEEIAEARVNKEQPLIFQLYIRRDKAVSEAIVKRVEDLGFRAIMLTVDAPVLGRRELDMRTKEIFEDEEDLPEIDIGEKSGLGGVGATIYAGMKVDLGWEDVDWLSDVTKLPIIIKGIQTVDDCVLASKHHGVRGIVLSNHGGRQSDYAPASIDVLYELRTKHPEVFDKVEVYVDGGFRRGTDVLKAICLGAKACGLGRPFLYANGTYGERGVVKTVRILAEELKNAMQQIGLRNLAEASPEYVQHIDRCTAIRDSKPSD